MTEFERIEKRFKQLRDFLTERQAEDPDADRHDEGDGYNIARVDLHEIKLAFFALAQERDRLRLKLEMWQDGNIMAESHSEEIERLREQLRLANIDNFNTTAELDQVRVERDDARWRLCKVVGDNRDMWGEDVAKEYGWDCFKEDGKCSNG
jgi:hypothetical protein